MRRCTTCQSEIQATAIYCTNCGVSQPKPNKLIPVFIASGASLVFALIGLVWLYSFAMRTRSVNGAESGTQSKIDRELTRPVVLSLSRGISIPVIKWLDISPGVSDSYVKLIGYGVIDCHVEQYGGHTLLTNCQPGLEGRWLTRRGTQLQILLGYVEPSEVRGITNDSVTATTATAQVDFKFSPSPDFGMYQKYRADLDAACATGLGSGYGIVRLATKQDSSIFYPHAPDAVMSRGTTGVMQFRLYDNGWRLEGYQPGE